MIQTRLSIVSLSAVAALALAACAPPTTPTDSPTPPATSATPAATATSGASVAPSTDPSVAPVGSPTPSALPSVPAGEVGILRGVVYDGKTNKVPDGTTVTITSLDATRPYTATVTTADGNYVANGVPLDTQISVSATRPGWTTRTRTGVVRAYDPRLISPNVMNFGGKVTQDERSGISYFLSSYPEIARVEPTDQDSSLTATQMTFKLTMSEPLDAENRRRLAAAFRIIPNSAEALSEDTSLPGLVEDDTELDGLRISTASDDKQVLRYAFRQNSGFLNGAEISTFVWDSKNLTATFTLNAPLKTDKDDEAEYAFFLIQSTKDAIEDTEGNALGTNIKGEFGKGVSGAFLYNTIVEPAVNLTEGFDDEEERWADTHLSFTRFSVAADETAPTLVSVLARRNYVDDGTGASDRIELTFSEPMVAFPRITSPGLLSLNNYVIATSDSSSELEGRKLGNGTSANTIAAGSNADSVRTALGGSAGIAIGSNRERDGDFAVSISVRDPKTIILTLPAGSFPLDAEFIRLVVGSDKDNGGNGDSVTDPAGNAVPTSGGSRVGDIL